jgi:hypothetical protein
LIIRQSPETMSWEDGMSIHKPRHDNTPFCIDHFRCSPEKPPF